jgi:hypothetical protein
MRSFRRASRVAHGFTAFVTAWCLGCSAFEPLLGAFAGDAARPGMVCTPKMDVSGTALDQMGGSGAWSAAVSNSESGSRGFECGCQSCVAPAAIAPTLAAAPPPHPEVLSAPPTTPESVGHEPLVPPPQRRA